MEFLVSDTGGTKRDPVPAGTHAAVCFGLIDLGTQPNKFDPGKGPKPKLWMWWELCGETQADGKPMTIGNFYARSLFERSNLRALLQSWRGKPFTEEELKGFNLTNVLGAPCLLTVINEAKAGGGVRDKITAVSGLPKGMPRPALTMPKTVLSLAPDKFDRATYDGLPPFLKAVIGDSPEGRALGLGTGNGQPTGGKRWPTTPADDWDEQGRPIRNANGVTTNGDGGDDIPF